MLLPHLPLLAQIDTSTVAIDTITPLIDAFGGVIGAFGGGIAVGLVEVFGFLFLITRFKPLATFLENSDADFLTPLLRAIAVLGGGVAAGAVIGGWAAIVGGLLTAAVPAFFFIQRTIEEIND